ncbi:hypothetical protein HY797_03480 [Candidatus Falkowbacteria bacterium]|nr:hypothetical protein [Candidatus Falkowbacteria bacterium]
MNINTAEAFVETRAVKGEEKLYKNTCSVCGFGGGVKEGSKVCIICLGRLMVEAKSS